MRGTSRLFGVRGEKQLAFHYILQYVDLSLLGVGSASALFVGCAT